MTTTTTKTIAMTMTTTTRNKTMTIIVTIAHDQVTTTHHHPSLWHAGDEPRQNTDWGLHQVAISNYD